jgi:pyrroline-5-carboxylate reductase
MGISILNNLLDNSIVKASQIKVIKPSDLNKISKVTYLKSSSDLPKNYQADLVFLAIKPQNSKPIFEELLKAKIFHKNTIVISIIAGKKVKFFEEIFGKDRKIIRSMPNLPIQLSQGIFPYFCNQNIKKEDLKILKKIFSTFGYVFEIENENLFDPITAIFGSGPAYIFLLQEIFQKIINQKITKDKKFSFDLVNQLFLGSVFLSLKNNDSSFSNLKKSVCSKKGTTEFGLKALEKNSSLEKIFKKAIDEAEKRSKELSSLDEK